MRVFQYQRQYNSKLEEITLLDFRLREIFLALTAFRLEECADKNLNKRRLQQTVELDGLEIANRHPNL